MSQKKFNYQKAIEEIESIVDKIENGSPDVDQLSAMVKKAAALIKACRSKLHDTSQELDSILGEFDHE
jgi:exodeoxyribonuclease VII small subunit